MMRIRFIVLVGLFALLAGCNLASSPADTTLQPETTETVLTCDQLVTTALETADQACSKVGRNQACYGNSLIDAELQENSPDVFNKVGNIANLFSIKQLTTAPLDTASQVWGIAVLKVQANLPDTLPGQNVTVLLYGDATLEGVTPQMKAVTLRTGVSSTACASAPKAAMLVQSPEGTQATLTVNGATVTLGSTLYFTADAGTEMTIATIEGQAIISAFNTTRIAQAGAQVRLPLGGADNLQVVGAPSEPEPFDVQAVSQAPIPLLERNVSIGPAISTTNQQPAATNTTTISIPATTAVQTACTPRADWTAPYVIQRGDTLFAVAQRFNLTLAQLQQANCISDPNLIQVGQSLRVPFQLATSAPATTAPVGSPTPTDPNLRADNTFLKPGECTTIRWDVANVSQVYFEGQPTVGSSTQQVCPATSSTYTLLVIHPDGKQIPYTLRIEVALPATTEEPTKRGG
ncbi:MAG: LysM peptidoglycan-binding domain-containing protein [Chloroflexota bacterium]